MGMDLLGKHGDERFNAGGWRWCLERAKEFGWTPEGTVAPKDFPREWGGHYLTNDYQTVTDSDARSLGEALLRAAAALYAREKDKIQEEATVDFPATHFGYQVSCLQRLAAYALKGGFVIA
jgi:hypothetical protein